MIPQYAKSPESKHVSCAFILKFDIYLLPLAF